MREDNIVSTQTLSKWFLPVTPSLEGYFLFLFHQRIVEKHKWVWYCPWPYQASALWQRNFLLILSYFLQNPPRKLGGESLAYCSCLFVKCPSRNGSDLADVLPTALNYGILSCLIWWNISNCLYRRVSLCVNSCDYCLIRRNSWDSLHGDGTSAAMTAHPKNCRVEFLFGCLSEGLTRQNVPEIGVSQSSAVNGFQFACRYSINTDSVCLVDCCARLWRHGLSHSHSHSCLGMSQTRHYTFGSFSFKEVHGRWYIQEWKGCSCVLQVIENSVKANSRIAQCSANFAALYCPSSSKSERWTTLQMQPRGFQIFGVSNLPHKSVSSDPSLKHSKWMPLHPFAKIKTTRSRDPKTPDTHHNQFPLFREILLPLLMSLFRCGWWMGRWMGTRWWWRRHQFLSNQRRAGVGTVKITDMPLRWSKSSSCCLCDWNKVLWLQKQTWEPWQEILFTVEICVACRYVTYVSWEILTVPCTTHTVLHRTCCIY